MKCHIHIVDNLKKTSVGKSW